MNGGRSAGYWRASCSTPAKFSSPIALRARAPRPQRKTRGSISSSPLAGSRCATQRSGNRHAALRADRATHRASDIARRAPPIGRDARPKRWDVATKRARHYDARRAIPGRLLRPAGARAARRRRDFAAAHACTEPDGERATLARLEIVRAVEILYAIDERDLVVPIAADLAERAPDAARSRCGRSSFAKHSDARTLLLIGKGAMARGLPFECMPSRPRACRATRRSGRGRAADRLLDRAAGKRVQSESGFERQCARSDAGDAGRRKAHRQAASAWPSTRNACSTIRSTTCRSARPSWAT